MPSTHVFSNVSKASVDTAHAIRELPKHLSLALDRPKQAVMVQLSLDESMLFVGSDASFEQHCSRDSHSRIDHLELQAPALLPSTTSNLKMPFVHVSSNVAKAAVDVPHAIRELSKSLSTALDRPEPAVMVKLSLDQAMLFAGSDTPCAFIQIRSIGKIDTERNPKTAQALTATVTELLGVPADRVFMNLDDIQITNWGANGTTVDKLGPIPKDKLSSTTSGEFQECSGSGTSSTAMPVKSSSVRPAIPSVSPVPLDQGPPDTIVEHKESLKIVREAQTYKRRARTKAFETNLKLSWVQYIGSLVSLILVCTDIPRSGLGVNQHLTKYATLEPDVFKLFGPWHYPMFNTSQSDAHQVQARVWSYKQDTTSKGLRAFAKFFALSTFPDCATYQGSCSSAALSGDVVFEMLDSLVNATTSMKPFRTTITRPVDSEPISTTLRSKSLYLDRLHQYLLPQVFANPIWRTNRIFYYAPHLLLPSSGTTTLSSKSLCFDFDTRPSFCQQLWSNFHHSCPRSSPDCRAVGRISEHTMARMREVQQMYPMLQVDLTILESHDDLQFNKGGFSPTGLRKRDVVTIIRARQCNDAACSTVFISEYRYEIGVVYSDALQWYHVVSWLRAMGQGYYYLRIAMLLKFCFDLTRNEDGSVGDEKLTDPHQPSLRTRVFKSCVLLLKTPMQVIIFGSLFPIFLYICAYAIDAAITYEVLANIFTSQNGFFKLRFQDMCTVGFNQMRSVWLLAMALHVYVQLRASTRRKLSWRPIHGIWGVPEFLLSALASVTMLAQLRTKAFRDARILSVFEIVDSRKLQAIKYHWNLGIRGYGHVSLGGAFIDLKFFVFLIALLYVGIWVQESCNYYSRSRASSLQTKTPVSYAAGILWPVGAMCIHWSSDYFCIKPPLPLPPVPRQTMQPSCSTSTKTDSRVSSSRMNQTINRYPPSVLSSFLMDNATFASIQSQMANLHDRHDDDVDSSIAFMNLVAMSDPIVYFNLMRGNDRGELLGYYRSRRNRKKLFLLPCEVVNAPHSQLHDLELVCTVRSSELRFTDLIHCG